MAESEQKRVTYEYIDADEARAAPQTDEEAAFTNFRNSFTGDDMGILRVSRLRVSKFTKNLQSLKGAQCFSVPIDQYQFDELLEVLRERYGGGLYRLVGIQKGHQGTKFNTLVEIAEDLSVNRDEKTGQDTGGGSNVGVIMDTVSGMLADSQERTEKMFERFAPQAQTLANPMTAMKETIEMLATLGVVGAKAQPDMLGELERLAKLKDLASSFAGDSGAGANFYDMAGKVVENFGPAFMAMAAQMQTPGQPVTATPGQPPALAPPEVEKPPEPNPVQNHIDQMKPQVAILVNNAKNGADANAVADMVVNMTPDERLNDLYEMIAAENCIERLIKLNPEVQEYLPFFEALRERIKWLLLPEDEQTIVPESDAAGEDKGGADSDAKPDGDPESATLDT